MSTPRPDDSLDWATDGTNVLEPSSGKRAQGWLPGEAPPAQFFNWWKALAARWVKYLDEQIAAIVVPDVSDVARLHVVNTFTETILFDIASASTPLFGTNSTPPDDPYVGSGGSHNRWKELGYFKHAGGHYVRVLSGQNVDDDFGAFAIVVNCNWSVDNQRWEQDDPTLPSCALLWNYGKLRVSGQPASTANWPSWPTDKGDLGVGGTITAKDVSASQTECSGDATVGGNLSVTGAVHSNSATVDDTVTASELVSLGDVVASGQFLYDSMLEQELQINLQAATVDYYVNEGLSTPIGSPPAFAPAWARRNASTLEAPNWAARWGGRLFVAIKLPHGAELRDIQISHRQFDTNLNTFKLRIDTTDWLSFAAPSTALLDSDAPGASAGDQITAFTGSLATPITIDNYSKSYTLECAPGAIDADDPCRVYRVRVRVGLPGPRDY